MKTHEFLDRVEAALVPHHYRKRLTKNVPESWRFYRKGAYVFAAVPYSEIPEGDYGNAYVKGGVKKIVFTLPVLAEKGLFLLLHGPVSDWEPHKEHHRVDKTALRPVIMQSIHYVDAETGSSFNSRTAWGPVKFGFCGRVIEDIELLCAQLGKTTD